MANTGCFNWTLDSALTIHQIFSYGERISVPGLTARP